MPALTASCATAGLRQEKPWPNVKINAHEAREEAIRKYEPNTPLEFYGPEEREMLGRLLATLDRTGVRPKEYREFRRMASGFYLSGPQEAAITLLHAREAAGNGHPREQAQNLRIQASDDSLKKLASSISDEMAGKPVAEVSWRIGLAAKMFRVLNATADSLEAGRPIWKRMFALPKAKGGRESHKKPGQ
ncbi:MAG: hypothetical protein V1708_02390 [Candidatus Micrarchaeota archaeon]